jgi:orotate phosphoribosyltransferase
MNPSSRIGRCAPQFLVADLERSVAYYRDCLGFSQRIDYGGFYASVCRGAAEVHLKCAPGLAGHHQHRRDNKHLDAFIDVDDVAALHREFTDRDARILHGVMAHPWGAIDFYVTDPDGYIMCFSQAADAATQRAEVASRVRRCALLTGTFTLRSGAVSDTYFDKYQFESDPLLLRDVAALMQPLIPAGTDVLAGLELGGIPLVTVLGQLTGLPTAFLRKSAKAYGTARHAEGPDLLGRRVTLIEDVVTSGGAILEQLALLRGAGIQPLAVACVVDRDSGGGAALAAAGLPLHALFQARDLAAG